MKFISAAGWGLPSSVISLAGDQILLALLICQRIGLGYLFLTINLEQINLSVTGSSDF